MLRRTGYQVDVLDDGCCGLAGSFGWEDGHYDVSIAAGECQLFPAVREMADDTRIVSDWFSCSSQIEHGMSQEPLHLAEVLADARRTRIHNGG